MLDTTFEETRVFQEVKEDAMRQGQQEGRIQGRQEGRKEAAASLIIRLLGKCFSELSKDTQTSISELPLMSLEEPSEALLYFSDVAEVERWLSKQADQG